MIEDIANTIALGLVAIAMMIYINENVDKHTAGCERWGFILTAAGAAGHAAGYWWPWGGAEEVETILHIGLALTAIAMVRGDLRLMLDRAKTSWDGIDRRARQ
jgi:hypothetical protein